MMCVKCKIKEKLKNRSLCTACKYDAERAKKGKTRKPKSYLGTISIKENKSFSIKNTDNSFSFAEDTNIKRCKVCRIHKTRGGYTTDEQTVCRICVNNNRGSINYMDRPHVTNRPITVDNFNNWY